MSDCRQCMEYENLIESLRGEIRGEQDAVDELNETNRVLYSHVCDLKKEVQQLKRRLKK